MTVWGPGMTVWGPGMTVWGCENLFYVFSYPRYFCVMGIGNG